MAQRIILKKSNIPGKVPLSTDIEVGEIALNIADKIAYSKHANGEVYILSADPIYTTGLQDKLDAKANLSGATFTGNVAIDAMLTVDHIQLNTNATTDLQIGEIIWNDDARTYNFGVGNGVVGQGFQELYYPLVKNNTANTIPNGTPVGWVGDEEGHIVVAPYSANTEIFADPQMYLGIATESIASGSLGFITYFGQINDINTSAWPVGTVLYASDTVAGGITSTSPVPPANIVVVGSVIKQHATEGSIFTRNAVNPRADQIPYDPTVAGMESRNVKGALDELQFSKADVGTLASNLTLYPTNYTANVSTYQVLVSSIEDPRYNDTEYDFAFNITTTNQLLATRITDPGLIVGNPGVITLTYLAFLRKTDSNQTKFSEFYWEFYKRSAAGTETLISTSSASGDITQTNWMMYPMYLTLNDGIWLESDRLVIRTYGNSMTGADGGSYESRLGGLNPSRISVPIPANVVPTPPANKIITNTTNFNGILTSTETNVQLALDKIDDVVAPINSPTFTGTPAAPTPASGTNSTQIATTAFVEARSIKAEDLALAMAIALG